MVVTLNREHTRENEKYPLPPGSEYLLEYPATRWLGICSSRSSPPSSSRRASGDPKCHPETKRVSERVSVKSI